MTGRKWSSAIAVVLAVALASATAVAINGADFVQSRRVQFDEMSAAARYSADHWRDPATYPRIAEAGRVIQKDAMSLYKLFPEGSAPKDGVRTAALNSVWDDRPGFDRLVKQLADTAGQLARITPASPQDEVYKQVAAVVGACKECHRSYRAQ